MVFDDVIAQEVEKQVKEKIISSNQELLQEVYGFFVFFHSDLKDQMFVISRENSRLKNDLQLLQKDLNLYLKILIFIFGFLFIYLLRHF